MTEIETTEPTEGLDDDAKARAVEIGNAIQHAVAARKDLMFSPIGMGLDLLSQTLITKPDTVLDLGPWVVLAADVFAFVLDGSTTDALDALRAGDLGL